MNCGLKTRNNKKKNKFITYSFNTLQLHKKCVLLSFWVGDWGWKTNGATLLSTGVSDSDAKRAAQGLNTLMQQEGGVIQFSGELMP